MTEWVRVTGEKLMRGDVWRWQEAVYEARGPRGGRYVLMGYRVVTAQCLKEEERAGHWVFEVRSCVVGESRNWQCAIPSFKVGEKIERTYAKIMKGQPERLLWSEEGMRSVMASKFLGNEAQEQLMSTESGGERASVRQDEPPAGARKKRKKSGGSKRPKGPRGRPGMKLRP